MLQLRPDRSGSGARAPVLVLALLLAFVPGRETGVTSGTTDTARAVAASERFLDDWVADDGRVVRHDQGGDTVSEGQAYALMLAAGIGDEATFRSVWRWTRNELQRPDGLFSWRWADGRIVGHGAAADADLFIAGALSLAARRFDAPALDVESRRISDAVLEREVIRIGAHRTLAAGPWAVPDRTVNPSYLATPIMSRLWWDGGHGWAPVAATSRDILDDLTATWPHLPPDWATVAADDGPIDAAPSREWKVYGWDAMRVPVQLAADCNPAGREIAARLWPFFSSRGVEVANVYSLDGREIDGGTHAAAIVGAAGAASAAGSTDSARVLLDRAARWDAEHPTYYGAAWSALGRLWLTTDLLGGCAN